MLTRSSASKNGSTSDFKVIYTTSGSGLLFTFIVKELYPKINPINLTIVIFIPTMESPWGPFLGLNYSFKAAQLHTVNGKLN